MTTNVGNPDRALRLLAAIVLAALVITLSLGTALEAILLIAAAILAVTALVGTCPLYRLFGMSTCPAN